MNSMYGLINEFILSDIIALCGSKYYTNNAWARGGP